MPKAGGVPENLKPFKKGEPSPNPNGRPKKLPGLDELIGKVLGQDEDGNSQALDIINALVDKAKKGDVRAIELILERAYGKVTQKLDQSLTTRSVIIDVTGEHFSVQPKQSESEE